MVLIRQVKENSVQQGQLVVSVLVCLVALVSNEARGEFCVLPLLCRWRFVFVACFPFVHSRALAWFVCLSVSVFVLACVRSLFYFFLFCAE